MPKWVSWVLRKTKSELESYIAIARRCSVRMRKFQSSQNVRNTRCVATGSKCFIRCCNAFHDSARGFCLFLLQKG